MISRITSFCRLKAGVSLLATSQNPTRERRTCRFPRLQNGSSKPSLNGFGKSFYMEGRIAFCNRFLRFEFRCGPHRFITVLLPFLVFHFLFLPPASAQNDTLSRAKQNDQNRIAVIARAALLSRRHCW